MIKCIYNIKVINIQEQFNAAPLSSSFVIVSILGFLISVFYVPNFSVKFAAAFALVFLMMFLASFISMSKAPLDEKAVDNDLSIHEPHKHLRKARAKHHPYVKVEEKR